MRKTKALKGVMFCLLLVGCSSTSGPEDSDTELTEGDYVLLTANGDAIIPLGPTGSVISWLYLMVVGDLELGSKPHVSMVMNPSQGGLARNGLLWCGDYSQAGNLVTVSWRWCGILPAPDDPVRLDTEEAMSLVGNTVFIEGDWAYLEVDLVEDEESVLYPFSQSRLGYLEHSLACAQAEADFRGALLCDNYGY